MVYDLNGNRTGKKGERLGADGKRQEMDTAYSYDLLNRMTEERRGQEGERYAYDPAGNRTGKQSYHYALTAAENRGSHPAAIRQAEQLASAISTAL